MPHSSQEPAVSGPCTEYHKPKPPKDLPSRPFPTITGGNWDWTGPLGSGNLEKKKIKLNLQISPLPDDLLGKKNNSPKYL
ncbi:hypothetical protein Micbo1qcDRAFT_168008, partial [Microdochium bolleyi]